MKKNDLNTTTSLKSTLFMGACALLLVVAIVSAPAPAFQASLQGLTLWWQIVFPALLPFLVLSEILMAYGFVHAIGALLNPLMRKVFGLPGTGGWVLIMGMTTGYPSGARATQQLYRQGDISGNDAAKLAMLSHFCNPLMILLVIATGLMHQPSAGYALIVIHWLSGLLAFLTVYPPLKQQRRKSTAMNSGPLPTDSISSTVLPQANEYHMRHMFHAAENARASDGRSFGRMLGESVTNAVQTLMMIGGYIIIFSVITQIFSRVLPSQLPLATYWQHGLFEIHLGAKAVSIAGIPSAVLQWSILSALLGFSGISALLQTKSMLANTGASWFTFIFLKLLHAGYAFLMTWLTWPLLKRFFEASNPAFLPEPALRSKELFISPNLWSTFPNILGWQGIILCGLIILSLAVKLIATKRIH
ncbi:nucleoside recognition domain-containing protein [Paenibacillus pini]|uniref:Membrane protein n=1 Tax=Paenibacillus pini JCM 16418 TaxID=1236976 RepID=W7YGK4_9BACL|nr:nucleoside recognition domain-containing protein [Paenibacillus pini]GAF06698.1 membrane protein [Paenibacillus pini JCM 16418]